MLPGALLGLLTSRVSFKAMAGTTYRLAVDGYHGAVGNIALGLTETVPPPVVIPANDNFSQRIVLTGANVSTRGSNVRASLERGEPRVAGTPGGHSIWWSWTAPAAGRVTISTAGSNFDTLLGVYTGTAVNKLSLVASNDEDSNDDSGNGTSRVTFKAVAGKKYQIAVDGFYGENEAWVEKPEAFRLWAKAIRKFAWKSLTKHDADYIGHDALAWLRGEGGKLVS
jgi:hypothetical protein